MPKCKNIECKKQFEKKRSNQLVCSVECSYAYAKQQREKKAKREWREEKKRIKEKLKTKKDYEKELQVVFNSYIRERDKGKGCISCGVTLTGKFDAGHFYPVGSYKNLRFDEDNVHGQCVHCNQHKHGNLNEYRFGLAARIGYDRLEALDKRRLEVRKYTIPELIELKVIYKDKLKNLKNI